MNNSIFKIILVMMMFITFPSGLYAADTKVVNMTAASTPDGTELFYVSQGAADRKLTLSQIPPYLFAMASGDCTANSSGVLTCTKTGGTSFGSLATKSSIDISTSEVTGILAIANGGTGTSSPAIVAGTGISVSGSWPNQTITATASVEPPSPGISSSRWYLPFGMLPASGTYPTQNAINLIRCAPASFMRKVTILSVATRVHTLESGKKLQFALYTNGTNNRPDALIAASGDLSLSAVGTVAADLSAAKEVGPGGANGGQNLWVCSNTDSLNASLQPVNTTQGLGPAMIGTENVANTLQLPGTAQHVSHITTAGTFGTWGSLSSATWAYVTTPRMPIMAYKAQ